MNALEQATASVVVCALLLALDVGCTRSGAPSDGGAPGVFAAACSAECSDDLADLTVYRDAAGAIGVVTVQGSPSRCTHPPLRFFGPDGQERATIPLVPVTPGSPEAKRFEDIRQTQLGRLTKAESMLCRDVKH